MIARLSRIACAFRCKIAELEVNPMLLRASGDGAVAVDCLVRRRGIPCPLDPS